MSAGIRSNIESAVCGLYILPYIQSIYYEYIILNLNPPSGTWTAGVANEYK